MAKKNKVSTEPAPVKTDVKPDTTVQEPVEVEAIVYGVNVMLNIRSTPEKKDGNIITTVNKGVKIIVVDPEKAKDKEWYKIKIIDSKQEGYAMKKFIKII